MAFDGRLLMCRTEDLPPLPFAEPERVFGSAVACLEPGFEGRVRTCVAGCCLAGVTVPWNAHTLCGGNEPDEQIIPTGCVLENQQVGRRLYHTTTGWASPSQTVALRTGANAQGIFGFGGGGDCSPVNFVSHQMAIVFAGAPRSYSVWIRGEFGYPAGTVTFETCLLQEHLRPLVLDPFEPMIFAFPATHNSFSFACEPGSIRIDGWSQTWPIGRIDGILGRRARLTFEVPAFGAGGTDLRITSFWIDDTRSSDAYFVEARTVLGACGVERASYAVDVNARWDSMGLDVQMARASQNNPAADLILTNVEIV